MVQNNKVLTVSYGTFSCTLEGFDDSFETMKAIAEYFRDLAADDRYFGSEPPQPDAEMLTRIARRDASQRVEASQNESGLLLRATQTPETPRQELAPQAGAMTMAHTPTHEPPNPAPAGLADAEPVGEPPAPAADSISAKLQRIRAVVSHSDVPPSAYSEDEDTSLLASSTPPVDAVAAAFEAGALNAEDFAEPAAPMPEEPQQPVIDEADAEETDDLSAEAPTTSDEMEEAEAAEVPTVESEEQTAEAEELHVPMTPEHVQADDLEDAPEAAKLPAEPLFAELEEDIEEELEEEDVPNILNVEDVTVETADETAQDDQDTQTHGLLTAEDEENLLSEISEIESEFSERSSQKLTDDVDPEQDVLRLMAKTGEHMEDPSSSDARETYSHLRTAVAATEAELDDEAATHSKDAEYRGDLESVVSPRRPQVKVTSARPEADAPAPLKLVAEQRVDDQSEPTGPVMPRRVTSDLEDTGSEESGFAQFAQDQGAQSLPDLLEAAAAYLSFIEGQEQFSRPQLMNKVRSLKQDEFNREESLRSFGQLLRDGKIEKAGGGRFAASNLIGFRPDDERAVG
ncbi:MULTISPECIES: hypothetical protein [unclassified Ruegeria]|uniref:hypothetical protein n=1 Tax=unclassified Ruegeria TaxID=2625375 RepID=UPI0014921795|nr:MULTISPECIES: hypothetical protein [unclassified Ruegeria]NOD45836.1 hypothetical protein [Ruegeria sp. HKCCD5849]NOD50864.1 hypothetical protein [Ruegeria sp. HKCCD5851]NOD67671.1 hypothetical protein [Ruegeria sp. HKCCD7303]